MRLLFTWLSAGSLHLGDPAHRKNEALRISSVDIFLPLSWEQNSLN